MYLYSKQYNQLVNTFTSRYIFCKTEFSTKQVHLQVQNSNSMVNTFSTIGVFISFTLWNPQVDAFKSEFIYIFSFFFFLFLLQVKFCQVRMSLGTVKSEHSFYNVELLLCGSISSHLAFDHNFKSILCCRLLCYRHVLVSTQFPYVVCCL